jgi:DNA-binding PadR family transcriptional regulator
MHGERHGEAWGPPHEEEGWAPPRRGHGDEEEWAPPHRGRGRGRGPGPRRGRPFGPPGFGPMGFAGFGGSWPGEPKFHRARRVRRGDVRAAALSLLADEPRNGYQIIQGIAERSGGVWQPSPGSVYPALQQLEDEGLIQAETPEGGRRRYALTDEGRQYVDTHADEVRAPWDDVASSVGSDAIELRHLIGQLAMAAVQVVQVGTEDQVAQARKMLTDTRRRLYAILAAEDEPADD